MIDTDTLVSNIPIADVIERYTGQTVRGKKALCPFHNDKRPSLHLKTEKNTWKCFACGCGGNSINFCQQYFGDSFIEACRRLSQDFNIECGLYDPKRSRSPDIWQQVARKVEAERRQELKELRARIDDEIETLTTVHRVLYHLGYEAEAAKYADLLDQLQKADLYTAYKLLLSEWRNTNGLRYK